MAGMDSPRSSRSPGTPESSFLDGVFQLAGRKSPDTARFHRTRAPFTRLREVLGRMRGGHPPVHPADCQDPTCRQALGEHFYRRADGLALCPACFSRWRTEGRASKADEEL